MFNCRVRKPDIKRFLLFPIDKREAAWNSPGFARVSPRLNIALRSL
jgi:hypothetical protein